MRAKFTHWLGLSLVLIILGGAIFAYKAFELGYPIKANQRADVWTLQARVTVDPVAGPVKVIMDLPVSPPGYAIVNENFVSRSFGVTIETDDLRREAIWAVRRVSGPQTLYYRARVFRDQGQRAPRYVPPFPERPLLEEPHKTALNALTEAFRAQSADVATFVATVFERLNDPGPDENIALFQEGLNTAQKRAEIARLLLADARIPAEVAHAVQLVDEQRVAPGQIYLAVHNGDRWLYFDTETGREGLAPDTVVWWYGSNALATADGATVRDIAISTRRDPVSSLELAQERAEIRGSRWRDFSLLSLPLQTQSVYAVLLTIPVGAFLIALLRTMVGIRAFGTFMPVLIALAFRETKLIAGLILFTVIVASGLAVRFYLERLRLLLVPRLASVLIIVVLLMVAVSILTHNLEIQQGLSISLFPMVIIAMVIERMSIVWEERGPSEAMLNAAGSLFMAIIAYLVMGMDQLAHVLVVFPEVLLILLGLTIMIGRYSGYRLSELFRFNEFVSKRGA